MAKENLLAAAKGETIKVKGVLSGYTRNLTIPRTDEEMAKEKARQKELGWKYPKAWRIEANLDKPSIVCKTKGKPTEGEKYLADKIFQRTDKDSGEKIPTFTIQSQSKFAPKIGVKRGDKIHALNLSTGELAGLDEKIEMPSKILLEGQEVEVNYIISENDNGKFASVANIVFTDTPKFFVPTRSDDAGEDWDNFSKNNSAPEAEAAPTEDAPAEENNAVDDRWA